MSTIKEKKLLGCYPAQIMWLTSPDQEVIQHISGGYQAHGLLLVGAANVLYYASKTNEL